MQKCRSLNKKSFFENFICIYQSLPCLWNTKGKEYSNKLLQNEAYKQLIEKCKEIYPQVDIKYLRKKSNLYVLVSDEQRTRNTTRMGSGTKEVS